MSWESNSLEYFHNRADHNNSTAIVAIVLSGCVLLHSIYLHGYRRKWVRTLTEISASASLIGASVMYYANVYTTVRNVAYCTDLMGFGLCFTTSGICDCVLTYTRFRLFYKHTRIWMLDLFAGLFIAIFVGLSSVSFNTIVPLFLNLNEPTGIEALNSFYFWCYAPAFGLFTLGFTYKFVSKMLRYKQSRIEVHPKLLFLAYRSALHSIISVVTNSYTVGEAWYNPVRGQLIYFIIIPVSQHLLFNWNWQYHKVVDMWDGFSLFPRVEPFEDGAFSGELCAGALKVTTKRASPALFLNNDTARLETQDISDGQPSSKFNLYRIKEDDEEAGQNNSLSGEGQSLSQMQDVEDRQDPFLSLEVDLEVEQHAEASAESTASPCLLCLSLLTRAWLCVCANANNIEATSATNRIGVSSPSVEEIFALAESEGFM